MEIKVIRLQENELHNYREDLIQCMEDSLKVNRLDDYSGLSGRKVYQKMMGYYYMGKTDILGAFDGDKLIGYAQFFQKENKRVHLNQIAVREDYQGKGVGSILIQEVEQIVRECALTTMELFVNESNLIAKKFYQSHCFLTEKQLMVKKI